MERLGRSRRRRVRARRAIISGVVAVAALVTAASAGAVYKGYTADPAQYPWLVTLTFDGKENCGGALVAPKVVLTAGHCVTSSLRAGTRVVFGFHSGHSTTVAITQVIEHGFVGENDLWINDIAVLKLAAQPASARPIRVVASDPPIASKLTAIGFGCSSAPYVAAGAKCKSFPKDLQGVTLTRVRQDCRKMSTTDFCVEGGSSATNHGDSGGPVMIRSGGQWRLAGLVDLDASGSNLDDSAPFFADMTSIARELPWINTVVKTGVTARSYTVTPDAFGGMPNPGTLQPRSTGPSAILR